MKKAVSIIFFTAFVFNLSFAQETYNLEIIFKRTAWDSYPNMYCYGISLAGGDVNGDGYSDIAVGSDHWVDSLGWWAIDVYIFFGASVMDTFHDAVLRCPPHLGHNESALWIGDVNGDSISDIVVGDLGGINGERVRVFFGGSPLDTLVDLILREPATFGCSVAGGDINGDGFNDIIVGAYTHSSLDGRVYIYYGGPLLDTIPDVIINGHNGESMGITVGSGGDVNLDGYEDIVAGAFNNDEAGFWAGKVYVFLGGDPMDTIPDCWLHGEGVSHSLGWNGVDLLHNNTVYDRVLTGTPFWPNGFMAPNEGKIYVLDGGSSMDTIVDWWTVGETDSSFLGMWSAGAGDVNADGYEDILSGAPGKTGLHLGGIGYLWLGDSITDTIPDAWLTNNTLTYYGIGYHVASAGDVNGDGYDEVMFSNYASDSNKTVWVCRYTAEAVAERNAYGVERRVEIEVYPNPAKGMLTIRFNSPNERKVTVKLYDVTGRLVDEIFSDKVKIGTNEISIRSKELAAGVYFVRLETADYKKIEKVILLK